jgi:hypothetical protein
MPTELGATGTGARLASGIEHPPDATAALLGMTIDRRRSDLDSRSVVEVEIRVRPRSSRCLLAPHAAEVSIFRPDSRYHRLVLTASEWAAFLADVKTGGYDIKTEAWL